MISSRETSWRARLPHAPHHRQSGSRRSQERAPGPKQPIALGSLARLHRAAGRHAEAEPLFNDAIAAGQTALAREHPSVAIALGSLADPSGVVDPQAEASLGLEMERARGGIEFSREEDPDAAIQLNNLAYLYRAAGRHEEAEPLLKEALAITERALGREHPDIATSLSSLARLYRATGRYSEAEPLLKEAIAISEKMVGREHPTVAIWLYNLARLYQDTKRYAEAEPVLKEVIAISAKTIGKHNQGTARGQWAIANLYLAMDRNEEALQQASAALAIHEAVLGAKHQWTTDSVRTSAAALSALHRSAEATALLARFARPQ